MAESAKTKFWVTIDVETYFADNKLLPFDVNIYGAVKGEEYGVPKIMQICDDFHNLFYDANMVGGTWQNTHWNGVNILKNPFDLWVYQEIIFEKRPDLIIECGTAHGGSSYYMAQLLDLIGFFVLCKHLNYKPNVSFCNNGNFVWGNNNYDIRLFNFNEITISDDKCNFYLISS